MGSSKLAMNIKIANDVGKVSITLLSGLLIVVAAVGIAEAQEETSQNPTVNPFASTGEGGTQNQTQMALSNLTRADFSNVTSALDSARDSILTNSSRDAYTALNDADDALYTTALSKGSSAMTTIIKITDPMRNNIDNAQDAILQGDLPNAMKERNSAEVELIRITQELPTGEEEEEPPADQEESSEDEEE